MIDYQPSHASAIHVTLQYPNDHFLFSIIPRLALFDYYVW